MQAKIIALITPGSIGAAVGSTPLIIPGNTNRIKSPTNIDNGSLYFNPKSHNQSLAPVINVLSLFIILFLKIFYLIF